MEANVRGSKYADPPRESDLRVGGLKLRALALFLFVQMGMIVARAELPGRVSDVDLLAHIERPLECSVQAVRSAPPFRCKSSGRISKDITAPSAGCLARLKSKGREEVENVYLAEPCPKKGSHVSGLIIGGELLNYSEADCKSGKAVGEALQTPWNYIYAVSHIATAAELAQIKAVIANRKKLSTTHD